jgi:hypothetical protein
MRANAVGKSCSEVERAYIAGFLDADGAIMAVIERHREKRFGFRVRVALKVTQHDRKVLDWIKRTLCVGIVRANRAGDTRQTFDLHIRDRTDVHEILEMLVPHLRVKRKQAEMALRILNQTIESKNDLIKNARLADALSRFNVRSKNRRKNFVSKIQEYLSPND